MDVKELIEKTLNVKVVNLEEVKGKSFPLFDMVKVRGVKLALIKDPMFVVIEGEDVYEKKVEGNFVIAEMNGKYVIASYAGEPNIEALRGTDSQSAEEEAEEEAGQMEEGAGGGEDREEPKDEGGDDPVKEVVEKIPSWADGAVIVRKEGNVVAMPIKRSAKKEGAYYASVSWKPLDIRGDIEDLVNRIIMKSGRTAKANIYVGDKYINIFVGQNRPRGRGRYSGWRR